MAKNALSNFLRFVIFNTPLVQLHSSDELARSLSKN